MGNKNELDQSPTVYGIKQTTRGLRRAAIEFYRISLKPGVWEISNEIPYYVDKLTVRKKNNDVVVDRAIRILFGVAVLIISNIIPPENDFGNMVDVIKHNDVSLVATGYTGLQFVDMTTSWWKAYWANQQLKQK